MSLLDFYRLAEQAVPGQRLPMMLFPIGEWRSAKYPKLPLTRDLAEELIANFEAGVLGTEPVIDSSGRHDTSTEAAGWFKRLYVAPLRDGGEALFGDWEPTDLGASLLNDRRYQYNSVEIGDVVDNATGKRTQNVLRSATLTNTPVLRMLPPVLEAGEAIAEPVSLALSEIEAADEDPVSGLLADMDALAERLDGALKGKRGVPSIRSFLREIRAKVSAHKLAEPGSYQDLREAIERALTDLLSGRQWVVDFGDSWVIYENGALEDAPRLWRVPYVREGPEITFGTPVEVERQTNYIPKSPSPPEPSGDATAEPVGDSASGTGVGLSTPSIRKEKKRMSELTELLQLAEDADDALILAEVKKVTAKIDAEKARADAAEAKLAEGEQAERVRLLDEAIGAAHIAPAEKDAFVRLAERDPETFAAMLELRKQCRVVELGERGSGDPASERTYANASVELAERAKERATKDGSTYSVAERRVLTEDADLAERYRDFRMGKEA